MESAEEAPESAKILLNANSYKAVNNRYGGSILVLKNNEPI